MNYGLSVKTRRVVTHSPTHCNKAGYTAIPVADGWAGAEMRGFTLFDSCTPTDRRTDRRTDGGTDGRTDGQRLLYSCVSATKKI